jgi:hypothetical protein
VDALVSIFVFKINLRRYTTVLAALGPGAWVADLRVSLGREMQVDPIKPMLKAPGS